MKSDLYTKAVLTVIAIMLTLIVCNHYINPRSTVSAQSALFAGVQPCGNGCFFDTRTGDIWQYTEEVGPSGVATGKLYVHDHMKLTKLGEAGTYQEFPHR